MSERRWMAGDSTHVDGINFRVVEGRKADRPGGAGVDLRLERQASSTCWLPVRMELGFFLADFFYENEDALYPPPRYQGGEQYMMYVKGATRLGWRVAQRQLEARKMAKQERGAA